MRNSLAGGGPKDIARQVGVWLRAVAQRGLWGGLGGWAVQMGQDFAIDLTLAARQKPQGFTQDITMSAEGFSKMADPTMRVFLPGKPDPWRDVGKADKCAPFCPLSLQ